MRSLKVTPQRRQTKWTMKKLFVVPVNQTLKNRWYAKIQFRLLSTIFYNRDRYIRRILFFMVMRKRIEVAEYF